MYNVNFMRNNKIINSIKLSFFVVLIILLMILLTFIMRGNPIWIKEFDKEKKDSIDIVCIGGSVMLEHWEPLRAYSNYGFTSYNLSTAGICAEDLLALLRHAHKKQNAKIYVVDVRPFQYYTTEFEESRLRCVSDSLNYGYNRFLLINDYIKKHSIQQENLSYYFDLIKYHSHISAFYSFKSFFNKIDNSQNFKKGCSLLSNWCYYNEPKNFKTTSISSMSPECYNTFVDLCEYAKKNKLELFFVVHPYYLIDSEHKEQEFHYSVYNALAQIANIYNFNFLNMNDYFNEIGIDFTTDMYDADHLNAIGAEKYTDFLSKYLKEIYNLCDHRAEYSFNDWNNLICLFENYSTETKNKVKNFIDNATHTKTLSKTLISITNFINWCKYVTDENYSILCIGNSNILLNAPYDVKKELENIGFANFNYIYNYIGVAKGGKLLKYNSNNENQLNIDIGNDRKKVNGILTNNDNSYDVAIDNDKFNKNFIKNNQLYFIVFDNNYRMVVDCVSIKININNDVDFIRYKFSS